jgi:flagellar export protein FliJ
MTIKRFDFRLQSVLEYRLLTEEWAKEAYLDAKTKRLEAEVALLGIQQERDDLLGTPAFDIEDLQALDLRLKLVDDKESQQRLVLQVLKNEEDNCFEQWQQRKNDVDIISKVRDKAYDEWQRDMDRAEQYALDEWSVQRRKAA